MRKLSITLIFVLGIVLTFGLAGCGSSDDDAATTTTSAPTTYTASGTYTFTDPTLEVSFATSTYPADSCGPSVGNETMTVTTLTATELTWLDPEDPTDTMTWSGSNSGDIVGTWTISFDGANTMFTLIFEADNTMSVSSDADVLSTCN